MPDSDQFGEPRTGVRGCVFCTAGGYGTRAGQMRAVQSGVSPITPPITPEWTCMLMWCEAGRDGGHTTLNRPHLCSTDAVADGSAAKHTPA
ncbi:MAG: hypothetical protein ACKON9_00055, partial [Planctomycetaceae bacterium]